MVGFSVRFSPYSIGVYCNKCSFLDFSFGYVRKKPRHCKKCGSENIIINFNGLEKASEKPNQIRDKYNKKYTISIIITMIVTFSVFTAYWLVAFYTGSINLLISGQIGQIVILLLISALVVAFDAIIFYKFASKPKDVEYNEFLHNIISKILRNHLSNIPRYVKNSNSFIERRVKEPENLKVVNIVDYPTEIS